MTAEQSGSDMAFQSTLLMRGATAGEAGQLSRILFQSTLLMRGATRFQACL